MAMKTFLRANWDRVLAVGLVVLGVVALIVGWIGVSGTGLTPEQNPYLISGGLGGIALIAIGCTVWVSSDLQDEWRRLDAIEERLGELGPQPTRESVDAGGLATNGKADAPTRERQADTATSR
jgi:hypothetical protein